ncbi:MAG TPA: phage tail protein [Acidobacteriota bacterium]|nr:phage tail protein [Acidobacteriota bacterium]
MANAYPHENFRFLVQIDGLSVASFNQVVLPGGEVEIIEYREGGDPISRTRKIPGTVRYDTLTLVRGLSENNELYEWWRAVVDGNAVRRNLSVVLVDEGGEPVKVWRFSHAWPRAYRVTQLDSQRGQVLSEIVEITFEEMVMSQPG